MRINVCTRCHLEKPNSKFGLTSKNGTRYRRHTCNTCRNQQSRRQQIKQKHAFKQQAIILKGGKCADCNGVFDADCFDFHHRDPSTKEFNWGRYAKSTWNTVLKNIKDCDLLCCNCHKVRHWREKHGDAITYAQPAMNVLPPKPTAHLSDVTRQCVRCREILPIKRFHRKKNHKNGGYWLVHTCKRCATRLSYLRRRANRGRLRLKAIEYKGGECVNCGFDRHQAAFEFHHKDGTKEFNWPALSMRDWSVVKYELDKCTLLCGNCHRVEHKTVRLKVGN